MMDPDASPLPGSLVAFGIDVGSLYFKAVSLGPDGRPAFHHKALHGGEPRAHLDRFLARVPPGPARIGAAGALTHDTRYCVYDPVVCLHAAVRSRHPSARNILEVGASHLTLVRLDDRGRVASIHRNSLCASGTGSFLDAQAARMDIAYGEPLAEELSADPPSIATRCAVFAKSDLIYRQQEGTGKEALWSGLCRGLATSLLHALTRGRALSGSTVLCGGVALNDTLVGWLRRKLSENSEGAELFVMPRPDFAVACGAAMLARAGEPAGAGRDALPVSPSVRKKRPALKLDLSKHPGPDGARPKKDGAGNEITLHAPAAAARGSGAIGVHLGIDIGSTSTKLVLVDATGSVLLDVYRPTGADPVAAVWRLFEAVSAASRASGVDFIVRAAATTGSGRKLVGALIGADLVVNEITAHVAGAVRVDPAVETIFEIGGQDAKYMSVRDGGIVDANMNYVCAAGTGSFVEEQAARLGFTIDEIGEAALGTSPPFTSNRCTVFMEQDVLDLLNQGATRREAAGAVMYSVIDNYLGQVVGSRPVSARRVFFQGATARNRGLVAALEQTLGVEVVVSPLCHVLGAYGAALLAMGSVPEGTSRFRGFALGDRSVAIREYDCGLCANGCRLTRAEIAGASDRPAWGMKCGREAHEGQKRELAGHALFESVARHGLPAERPAAAAARPVVRIPRALTMYADHPFWRAFFDALGASVELGPPLSRRSLDVGRAFSGPDFCLPLKAAVGQVAELLGREDGTPVFMPFVLADYATPHFSHSRLCPYVEVVPAMARAALGGNGHDLSLLISPVVDLRQSDDFNAAGLTEALAPVLRIGRDDVVRALRQAHGARREHEEELLAKGRAALNKARSEGRPAVVVVGRPYSLMDPLLNHDVPRAVARCGVDVIPMICLDQDADGLQGEFRNLYWSYGQRILASLDRIAKTDGLYAVLVSSFGCGPDSFLLSYAEAIMGDKPVLILEIDEHGSSGGYETRIEAFVDVIREDARRRRGPRRGRALLAEPATASALKERTLWFPQMHPVGNRFFVAAFRSEGYDARTLPLEDESTHALGKKWTRGAECLPMALTLGAFLDRIDPKRTTAPDDALPPALFMATSTGPCRYGQYRTLERLIFERLGLEDVPILSPGAHNAYYGLKGRLRRRSWEGICVGDLLFKMRCRVLPYEITKGDTEEVLERACRRGEELVARRTMRWPVFLEKAMAEFQKVPVRREPRPLVGIVGEIYVRCNPFANGRIVETIEKLGGEAWLSPVSEWILYTAWIERFLARKRGEGPLKMLPLAAKWKYFTGTEHAMSRRLAPLLGDRTEPPMDEIMRAGGALLPVEFQGESVVTIGRAVLFGERGADLVVNCAPFGCMHGNITSAVFEQAKDRTRVPVVNVSYDGTGDNSVLGAFMHEARRRRA